MTLKSKTLFIMLWSLYQLAIKLFQLSIHNATLNLKGVVVDFQPGSFQPFKVQIQKQANRDTALANA